MSLDKIREKARDLVNENGSNLINLLCVLKDAEEKSGLLVNVSENNISDIEIMPKVTSRLAVVKCASAAETILYFYIMLTQFLAHASRQSTFPDLMKYARASGLYDPTVSISREDLTNTSYRWEGKQYQSEDIVKSQEMIERFFKKQLSESEMLEMFLLLSNLPQTSSVLRSHSTRIVKESTIVEELPDTATIVDILERRKKEKLDKNNEFILQKLVELLKGVAEGEYILGFTQIKGQQLQ